jgi:hypothetical protein
MSNIIAALWRLRRMTASNRLCRLAWSVSLLSCSIVALLGSLTNQPGSIAQILICAIAIIIVSRTRTKLTGSNNHLLFPAALGAPFAIFGALGSPIQLEIYGLSFCGLQSC